MKRRLVHVRTLFGSGMLCLAMAGALSICDDTHAALSVGPAGLAPQTFDTLPPVADWSALSVAGAAGDITDAATLDSAVIAGTVASGVNVALTADATQPAAQNATPRWNSAGHYVQTRTTGNKYQILMATLQNNSGADISSLIVGYHWAQGNALPVNESVPGHRTYYSTTGNANEWTLIPEFSNFSNNDAAFDLAATLTFATPWAQGAMLYIIWVDDNGPGSTSNPMEGSYSIDNFAVSLPGIPPSIAQQPAGVTNNEYSVVTLSAAGSGTPPLTYQWYRNGTEITGATGSSIVITNQNGSGKTWSVPSDSADYRVVVTGSVNPPATSSVAHVVISPDIVAPHFLWAVKETNDLGGTTVRVKLNEAVGNPLTDYNDVLSWQVTAVSGPGGNFGDLQAAIPTNNNEVHLVFSDVVDPATSYKVEYIGTAFFDLAASPNTQTDFDIPFNSHETEILPMNATWKYDEAVTQASPAADWFAPGFDDSDSSVWKTGVAPFDTKKSANQVAGLDCRDNTLYGLGPVGTCLALTNSATGVENPMVFFRTHFNLSSAVPTNLILRLSGKYDDFAVIYLNGSELERVRIPATADISSLNRTNYGNAISSSGAVGDTDGFDTAIIVPGSLLHQGDNVVAVNVLQINNTSSDMTMALRLLAATVEPLAAGGPTMHVVSGPGAGQITISWSGAGTLEQSTDVGPTASWSTVAGSSPQTIDTTGTHRFFRIHQ